MTGLYEAIKDNLGSEFSFREYCSKTGTTEDEHKEARNQLKAMAKRGYIRRVARNVFVKVK
ncbi:MAG TPA: hypothetical protein VKM55_31085 [Candidatus Lokiarchaeia archaeon]|nr:hypothetical protein [Candidatus Lokiarchaeia archaeon]